MKQKSIITICLSCFFLIIISCSDEEDILGNDLIDSNIYDVGLTVFPNDNHNIPLFALKEDSISARGNYNLLGHINDPYFGQSAAAFYMQVLLPSNNIDLNASKDTDFTVELSLPYFDHYGDTLENIEVSVFQLNENIGAGDTISDVFSDQDFDYNPLPLGTTNFNITNIKDSINWNNEVVSPRLIIDLSDSELGEIISSADLSSSESFINSFNGLYLRATETLNTGCIAYFNTSSTNCFLRISYINNNDEFQTIEFPIGSSSNRLNNFSHDYSNSVVNDYLDTENNLDSIVFLQSMGGVCSEINLNFLQSFKDSSYVISKATLNLPVFPDESNSLFYPPGYLILTDYNNEDVAVEGISGGIYSETEQGYKFVITQHVQKIISEHHNATMRLYVGGKNSNAERLLIDNREESHVNLELVIIK